MHLPKLDGEQLRVLGSMNKYWEEISGRDEPRRSECANNEMEVLLSVVTPIDVLKIISNFVTHYGQDIPVVPFDLRPYIHHHPDCNLNQDWDEAMQALSDTPQKDRDEGYYAAVEEVEHKRNQCSCKYR